VTATETEFQVQINLGAGHPSFAIYQLSGTGLLVQSKLLVKFPTTDASDDNVIGELLGEIFGLRSSTSAPEFVELKGSEALEAWLTGLIEKDTGNADFARDMAKRFMDRVFDQLDEPSGASRYEPGGYL